MKTILSLIAVIGLSATLAHAQFTQPPVVRSAITNSGTWEVRPSANDGNGSTNVATTQAQWVVVGRDGFGVAVKSYGTNAALTTNAAFTLEFSADGVNAITNASVVVQVLPRGVATNTYYTNFVTSTSALLGNVAAVRIKNYANTNGLIGASVAGTLFVEKFTFLTR